MHARKHTLIDRIMVHRCMPGLLHCGWRGKSYSSRTSLGYLFPVFSSAEYGTRLCTRNGNHLKSATMHAILEASSHPLLIPPFQYYVYTQSTSRQQIYEKGLKFDTSAAHMLSVKNWMNNHKVKSSIPADS